MSATETYKGHDAAELRRIFADMNSPEWWHRPRTQDENAQAVAAIEFCGQQS